MATKSRIIQVPIGEELLSKLDEISAERGESRAAVIREACARYLRDAERDRLDRIYEEGYRRVPETGAAGQAQLQLLGEVLPQDEW